MDEKQSRKFSEIYKKFKTQYLKISAYIRLKHKQKKVDYACIYDFKFFGGVGVVFLISSSDIKPEMDRI